MTGFLADKFTEAKFEQKTEDIKLECLQEFFEEGQEPIFKVRGLNSVELHNAIEAGNRNKSIDNILKAVTTDKDQITAVRKAMGISSEVPGEIAKRIEMFVIGCVSPKINLSFAVKFSETFPIEFFHVTNKIVELTGQGASRVKSQPSS